MEKGPAMPSHNRFANIKAWIKKTNYAIALIGGVVVFLTIFSTTIDVIGRFFNRPLTFISETSEIALAVMVFLGWAYTQMEKGHISIDLVYNYCPQKVKRILSMINPIFGIVLMGLMGYQGVIFSLQSKSSHEVSDSLHMVLWPFKFLIAVGAFMMCAQLIIDMIDMWLDGDIE
jgi:TRAP-type C4-dicarboxylate transport system permease small subunit